MEYHQCQIARARGCLLYDFERASVKCPYFGFPSSDGASLICSAAHRVPLTRQHIAPKERSPRHVVVQGAAQR